MVTNSTRIAISASGSGLTRTAPLTVQPAARFTVDLNPATVVTGTFSNGTLAFREPAPTGGIEATLTSSQPEVAFVPERVTVPAGVTEVTFPVVGTGLGGATQVVVTAEVDGVKRSATLTVLDYGVRSVTLEPSRVTSGGAVTGTVTMSRVMTAGGAVVELASDNPAVATLPARVTVPAGASQAEFAISTAAVSIPTAVVITARFANVTQAATLIVGSR